MIDGEPERRPGHGADVDHLAAHAAEGDAHPHHKIRAGRAFVVGEYDCRSRAADWEQRHAFGSIDLLIHWSGRWRSGNLPGIDRDPDVVPQAARERAGDPAGVVPRDVVEV